VSVIIPAYNRERLLPRALNSVNAQEELRPLEVIVVDDASSDDSAAVAERLGARVLRRTVNGGAAAARNDGLRAARGDWVTMLDSDDEWLPGFLRTLWPRRGDWSFVGGAMVQCASLDGPVRYHGPASRTPVHLDSPAGLYPENVVAASGVLADRRLALEVGGYSTDLRYAEDLDLWIRLIERRPALLVPDAVARWWKHPGQKSSQGGARADQLRIISRYEGAPWWSPRLVESNRAIRGWDALRAALADGRRAEVVREGRALLRPARLQPLVQALVLRERNRRRSAGLDAHGRPTVATLDGRQVPGARDLSRVSLPALAVTLVRRPPARAVGGDGLRRRLAGALGVELVDA
jgi:glycosyltransferase involved in cell wall biosynthesis